MDFYTLLEQRSSCRSYNKKGIENSIVEKVLKAGLRIPTPSNAQQIEIVRCDEEMKKTFAERLESGYELALLKWEKVEASKKVRNRIRNYYRYSTFMFDAPELFVITAKRRESISDILIANNVIPDNKIDEDAVSAGISLMAMSLAVENEGLKSCILTAPLFYLENLDLDENRVLAFFCFGEKEIIPESSEANEPRNKKNYMFK